MKINIKEINKYEREIRVVDLKERFASSGRVSRGKGKRKTGGKIEWKR